MTDSSYEQWVKAIRLARGEQKPLTRADVALAKGAVKSLYGSYIGAGRNTYRQALQDYEAACRVVGAFPEPCKATLYNVETDCPNLAAENSPVCEVCNKRIMVAMDRNLAQAGEWDLAEELLKEGKL